MIYKFLLINLALAATLSAATTPLELVESILDEKHTRITINSSNYPEKEAKQKKKKQKSPPCFWKMKRSMYNKLFASAKSQGSLAAYDYPSPPEDENVEIVPFSDVGLKIDGVYTAKEPPKAEQSTSRKLQIKLLSFLIDAFPLVVPDLPSASENSDNFVNLYFPVEYSALLPMPVLPLELANHPHDTVGACALSGPFAGYIRKAQPADYAGLKCLEHDKLFCIDFEEYEKFSAKGELENLGGTAILHYDNDQKYMKTYAIRYGGQWYQKDNLKNWLHVQKIMAATMSTDITISAHLLNTHLIIAGTFGAVTNKNLPKDHAIRTLLHPHQVGTAAINIYQVSPLLFGSNSAFIPTLFSYDLDTLKGIINEKAKSFDIADVDPNLSLCKRQMESIEFCYPYANQAKKLWGIVNTAVDKYVRLYYKSDDEITADKYLQNWYEDLKTYIPNKQIQSYVDHLSVDNLIKLLSFNIYANAVEHHNVGILVYNFFPHINQIPPHVRKDRENPSIGVVKALIDLFFLTQPASAFTMADEGFSEFIPDSDGKLIRHELCCELLRYQQELEKSHSITSSTIRPDKLQSSVNA